MDNIRTFTCSHSSVWLSTTKQSFRFQTPFAFGALLMLPRPDMAGQIRPEPQQPRLNGFTSSNLRGRSICTQVLQAKMIGEHQMSQNRKGATPGVIGSMNGTWLVSL